MQAKKGRTWGIEHYEKSDRFPLGLELLRDFECNGTTGAIPSKEKWTTGQERPHFPHVMGRQV